jgi:hypothetical protein
MFKWLLAVLFSFTMFQPMAFGQLDWMSKVIVPVEEAQQGGDAEASIVDEVRALVDRAEAAQILAQEAAELSVANAKLAKEAAESTRTFASSSEIESLRQQLDELRGRPAFTEDEIREFAKDEIKKASEAQVKMPDGSVKTIQADTFEATVAGYSGTFTVPVGGRIVSVDGQPLTQRAIYGESIIASTGHVTMQAAPSFQASDSRGVKVRFWSLPSTSQCRMVNGVKVCN